MPRVMWLQEHMLQDFYRDLQERVAVNCAQRIPQTLELQEHAAGVL